MIILRVGCVLRWVARIDAGMGHSHRGQIELVEAAGLKPLRNPFEE